MNAWNHGEALSFLVNFALDSLKVQSINIEKRPDGKKRVWETLRPQTHIFIQSPKGSFKSTILKQIGKVRDAPVFTDVTFASLVGSIDKETKQIVPAGAWLSRKNVFLIDEWADNFERKAVINSLLQLTEGGEYARSISRSSFPFEELDGDLFFKVKDGRIRIKTKFSLIMATMHNLLRSSNDETQALISRSIPYSFKLTQEEMDSVVSGVPLVVIKPKKKIKENVKIKYADFKRLLDKAHGAKETIFSRAFGDCCRCFALYGWNDAYFDFIIERKNYAETQAEIGKAQRAASFANLRPREPAQEV
jgi:hypothetical protein